MPRLLTAILFLFTVTPVFAQQSDQDAVKDVIVSAYIEGIHINSDADAARAGFHPEFIMHATRDGEVRQITADQWFSRLSGEKNEHEITYEFEDVTVVGPTASARLKVFRDGEHIYTDVLGLYKLKGDWKIVNKVFTAH